MSAAQLKPLRGESSNIDTPVLVFTAADGLINERGGASFRLIVPQRETPAAVVRRDTNHTALHHCCRSPRSGYHNQHNWPGVDPIRHRAIDAEINSGNNLRAARLPVMIQRRCRHLASCVVLRCTCDLVIAGCVTDTGLLTMKHKSKCGGVVLLSSQTKCCS